MDQPARLYLCARCRVQVVLCSRCDRGNRYCGRACRHQAREDARRQTAQRYQRSWHGRLAQHRRSCASGLQRLRPFKRLPADLRPELDALMLSMISTVSRLPMLGTAFVFSWAISAARSSGLARTTGRLGCAGLRAGQADRPGVDDVIQVN